MLTKLAKVTIAVMAAEDFSIAACYAATGNFKLALFWGAIGVTNCIAYTF